MNNWIKISDEEFDIEMSIAKLKKGELQIKYAKDIFAKDKEIERLNRIIEIKSNRIQDLMSRLSKRTEKVERLNNIINKAIKWFEDADRRGLQDLLDILRGSDKE